MPFENICRTHFNQPAIDKGINLVKFRYRIWFRKYLKICNVAHRPQHKSSPVYFNIYIFNKQKRGGEALCIFNLNGHPQFFLLTFRVYLN